MALQTINAQFFNRTLPDSPAKLELRDDWQLDGRIDELFRELKQQLIKRSGKLYGRLSDDSAVHPCKAWVKDWREGKQSFNSFSHKLMQQLKHEFDESEALLEGYVIFAHEKLQNEELFYAFVVQHQSAQFLNNELKLECCHYLDTGKLLLAAKLNLSEFEDDEQSSDKELLLLRNRGEKDISDHFSNSIGFSDKRDISKETESFLEVVNEFADKLPAVEAAVTRKQVVDYCLNQDKVGKPVELKDLSEEIEQGRKQVDSYQPGPRFDSFAKSDQRIQKTELIPDKTQLRNFVRISGRNEQMSMSFSSSCLGESVVYDAQSDSLIIKSIPASLKNRLMKHTKSSDNTSSEH
ncbi:nucleoid-associated protein [Agaribacterium haliotis]|uniref:nucleoid-associated protein n=1 Tax=Agaribacterium haliotis TaxID=2013869 RepID=UPI000BB52D8D|nr:nucleoid-associated protein [Agaribacterium haliotis]